MAIRSSARSPTRTCPPRSSWASGSRSMCSGSGSAASWPPSRCWTRPASGCARRRWRPLASLRRRMSVTVVGSIAYDAVRTPFGERERMLGGSAVHFALAASFFDEVRVVGPVGDDFAAADVELLERRGVLTADIERVAGGQTFFWRGAYGWDLNDRDTLDTQLNVFAEFQPKLSAASP